MTYPPSHGELPERANFKFLKAQKLVQGAWEDCNFRELRKGDTFRLEGGDVVYVAEEDAQPPSLREALNPYAVWGIKAKRQEG